MKKGKYTFAEIPVKDIVFGERAREDYGSLKELSDSIEEVDLIHPIAVEKLEEGKYLLLAGGRRFRVYESNGWEKIPCRIYEGLTDRERKKIELEENDVRKRFTWAERDILIAKINDFEIAQKAVSYTHLTLPTIYSV